MKPILLLILAGALVFTEPATGQKRNHDHRPLQNLNQQAIPLFESVSSFRLAHPNGELLSKAEVVAAADRVPMSTTRRSAAGKRFGGQKHRAGSLIDGIRIQRAENGTVRWMEGALGHLDAAMKTAGPGDYVTTALKLASAHAPILGLMSPSDELVLTKVDRDDLNYTHVRFEQTYRDIPVWGRDLVVHFNDLGEVYTINGALEPTPAAFNVQPDMPAGSALQIVVADLENRGRWSPLPESVARWLAMSDPESRLVFYPEPDRGMRLAYEVTLHANLLEWYTYIVDAGDGHVLNRIARHCSIFYDPTPRPVTTVTGWDPSGSITGSGTVAAFFDASAADLNGVTQTFRVYQHDDGLYYKIWDLPNFDAAKSALPDKPAGGGLTVSANNTDMGENIQLSHVNSNDNVWTDPVSVSAHANMKVAYDYYKTTHSRNAIDGNDESILSVIHATEGGQPMENAYWNGRSMIYGDGNTVFSPLAGALDVAGHEMTHGVIQHTADLIYQFQSGALNESFADFFGVMVDREDLLLAEDITKTKPAMRDMLNPGDPSLLSPQPASMAEYRNLSADQDNGGVHVNSGIPNRAGALVIQSVGREKAEQIYYRALSNYLTRNSQFGDARNAVEQAAKDLYGDPSAELDAVRAAFDDVGITSTTGTGGSEGNDLPPQSGGQSLITMLLEDGTIGLVDLTDPGNPQSFVFSDPQAVARVDAQNADWAQLSTPLGGERIWFVNQQNQLAFLEVSTGVVSVFTDLFIQQQGDLWNASVSPDEGVVALVSAYANDPTIYVFDGQELAAIPLKPETTQEGIQNETIQYPDVVSWSPNPQIPRVAFDALNEVNVGGTGSTLQYWSIYEIDFASGGIYGLVPAQPSEINVGNITYSNTDPDFIAFNVIDESGVWDTYVADYASGDITALDIPSYTYSDISITDGQRPTFAPDDNLLCFTSPSLGALFFLDGGTGEVSALDLQTALYNPRWFLLGGSGGTGNQAPVAAFESSTLSGTAPLQVSFDASSSSDIDGDPLTYRWDYGDGSTGSGVTSTHTFATSGRHTVALTVLDSGGLAGNASAEIVVSGVSVESAGELPSRVALHQNYPNPFNPETVIRFELPDRVDVELSVRDLLGRTVSVVLDQMMPAGVHERSLAAGGLPSGTYLVVLRAGDVVESTKIVLVR